MKIQTALLQHDKFDMSNENRSSNTKTVPTPNSSYYT